MTTCKCRYQVANTDIDELDKVQLDEQLSYRALAQLVFVSTTCCADDDDDDDDDDADDDDDDDDGADDDDDDDDDATAHQFVEQISTTCPCRTNIAAFDRRSRTDIEDLSLRCT